jgi:hypothetical protein
VFAPPIGQAGYILFSPDPAQVFLQGLGLLQGLHGGKLAGQFAVGKRPVDGAVARLTQIYRFGVFTSLLLG